MIGQALNDYWRVIISDLAAGGLWLPAAAYNEQQMMKRVDVPFIDARHV